MQIILYFIYKVKSRRLCKKACTGQTNTINLFMSEQVSRQRQVTLNEGKTLVNTKGLIIPDEGPLLETSNLFVSFR